MTYADGELDKIYRQIQLAMIKIATQIEQVETSLGDKQTDVQNAKEQLGKLTVTYQQSQERANLLHDLLEVSKIITVLEGQVSAGGDENAVEDLFNARSRYHSLRVLIADKTATFSNELANALNSLDKVTQEASKESDRLVGISQILHQLASVLSVLDKMASLLATA